ncbi:hypothetical protein [Paenibacillus sp. FSL K6-1230]|uniref:hypothetical protein n=1 Tax=Paenibacillus sp. FSL K6-1230 TaxID=2921603 RepID=UPI0030F81AE4
MGITYAEYLQENLGALPIEECLEVINKAEQGEMTDFDVEQELTPVVGRILSDLYINDREMFESVLFRIKESAELIKEKENNLSFCICPVHDGIDLITQFESVLVRMRNGAILSDHWIDEDGQLIISLDNPK